MTSRYLDEFAHPRVISAACIAGLGVSTAVAVSRPVPDWELQLTEWINDVPDIVASGLYPVMQMGTIGGPLVVATAIAISKRDLVLSAAVVVTGLVTWFAAKGVKQLVERGRPLAYLRDVVVREGDGSGLGFISGHSAVAASAAIMAMVVIPRRWRPVAAAIAGLVGVARIVHGVHLPADVVGGWSFGVLLGLGGLAAAGLARVSSDQDSSPSSVAP